MIIYATPEIFFREFFLKLSTKDTKYHLGKVLNSRDILKSMEKRGISADFFAYLFEILKFDIERLMDAGNKEAAATQAKACIKQLTELLKHTEGAKLDLQEKKEVEELSVPEILNRLKGTK